MQQTFQISLLELWYIHGGFHRFPKMGVLPNHPKLQHFSMKKSIDLENLPCFRSFS
jgi:hypothetical protein